MDLRTAQNAMRIAHVSGAPGVLVSGVVWVVAGLILSRSDVTHAFTVLFFGGMAIVPVALFIARVMMRAPKPVGKNPLDRLGLESTFSLFAGLLIAYALLRVDERTVFPIMAVTIGARYFTFRTIYDETLYWVLGAALIAIGGSSVLGRLTWPINLALVTGLVEVAFAVVLFARHRTSRR